MTDTTNPNREQAREVEDALMSGRAVLWGEGDGTYDEAVSAIEGLVAAVDNLLAHPSQNSHTAAPRPTNDPAAGSAGESGEDFLAQLRRVNLARYEAWVDGADAGIMFDALELGGEVGELLNVVKKLEREERGWRGSRADPADFADECADVLICLDKLARRRGIDLAAVTVAKFNATSEKQGFPHKLALHPTQDSRDVAGAEAMRELQRLGQEFAAAPAPALPETGVEG